MKIIFTTDGRIGSSIIKFFTASPWHHVGIIHGDRVFEARMRGVVLSELQEFKSRGEYRIIEAECDEKLALDFLYKQIGKPYDFAGAIGLPFRGSWQNEKKWYCSELVAAAFSAGGNPLVRARLRGVSPRDLWVLPL